VTDVAIATANMMKDLMNNVSDLDGSRLLVLSHIMHPGKRSSNPSLCRHLRRFGTEKGKIPVQ
jgi:hypothetical protein